MRLKVSLKKELHLEFPASKQIGWLVSCWLLLLWWRDGDDDDGDDVGDGGDGGDGDDGDEMVVSIRLLITSNVNL